MNKYFGFCLVEACDTNLTNNGDNSYAGMMEMCKQAEQKMMGFMVYGVELGGLAPKTAYQYARIVIVATRKTTGVDLEMREFKDLKLLHSRLKVLFPRTVRQRLPLVQQDYIEMWKVLDSRDPATKLFKAFTLTQFQAVCRFGDLVRVMRSDVTVKADVIVIIIREHKTSHHVGGQVFDTKYVAMPAERTALTWNLSAGLALVDYLRGDPNKRSVPLCEQYLFRTPDGKQIQYKQQMRRLRSVLAQVGKDPKLYGLHSPRIGGATCALVSSGGNEFIVKQMGFWKGDSVRQYARPTTGMIVQIQNSMMQTSSTALCNSGDASFVPRGDLDNTLPVPRRSKPPTPEVQTITKTSPAEDPELCIGQRVKTRSERFDVCESDSDGETRPLYSEQTGPYVYGTVLNKHRPVKGVPGTLRVRYDDGDEMWENRTDLVVTESDNDGE